MSNCSWARPMSTCLWSLAHEQMLVGQAYEHMLMGQAHEHLLMGQVHEHLLLAHEHILRRPSQEAGKPNWCWRVTKPNPVRSANTAFPPKPKSRVPEAWI